MSSPDAGLYIVRSKAARNQALLIGPVPLPYPPLDVPVRVGDKLIDRWTIRVSEDNTRNVFAGRGNPNDYKWVVKNGDELFVSAVRPPVNFRIESAGNNFHTVKLFGEDAALTYGGDDVPQLTFKPADGSDAQLFEFIRIDRN